MDVMFDTTNQDLREQDWMLWQQLQSLAVEQPECVHRRFDVPKAVVEVVATFSRQVIERLSSGSVSSFRPCFDTSKMLSLMKENYLPSMLSSDVFSCSTVGYLINVATAARCDPLVAALGYGIPSEICIEATRCTNSQLAYIANRMDIRFCLRFPPALLLELDKADANTRYIMLLKLSQSLRN